MEFKTEAQKACHAKVASMMKDLFGEFVMVRDDAPFFGIAIGSALAQTAVWPWGDDDASISTRAYVVTGAEQTTELFKFLLEKNGEMRFGAFGVDSDGDVFFQHCVVGSTCDKKELKTSVMAVVSTADSLDDEILARWGGQRALDKIQGAGKG